MLEAAPSLARAAAAAVGAVDAAAAARLLEATASARRVFVAGAGRSGLAARGFVIRLRQLGRDAFAAGEAATPAPQAGDLVILCSASAETPTVLAIESRALESGASVAAVTSERGPGRWRAPLVVVIPVAERSEAGPLGSVFELSAMLFFDALVVDLMARLGATEAQMRARHTTLE